LRGTQREVLVQSMISILLPDLNGGGAERVAVNLANIWSSWGYQIEFVLMKRRGVFLSAVAPSISIHNLDCTMIRQVPYALSRYLRTRRPSVLLANMWPLTSAAVLSWWLSGRPGKIFLCDHILLSEHVRRDLHVWLWGVKILLRLTYPSAKGVITVSKGVARDLVELTGLPESAVRVIYNPVVSTDISALSRHKDSSDRVRLWGGRFRKHILSVGSLKAQKNHRMLLRAFSKVALELDASLIILGEGDLRPTLAQDVINLGLVGRVVMPGFHLDPTAWYKAADLFVLSSDFEGFANVLAEALAWGTPVLSTDCPYGPSEILECGRYGVLVPADDADAFASGMCKALTLDWNRHELKRRALEFSIPKQAKAYLDFFNV
jgi:glycosyltransferase involved in cell wall biosynthesis